MVAGVSSNFGPFCSKNVSSGVTSFLERLITYLFWISEVVEEVAVVLKVFVVLEAIFEVVVEALEIRFLNLLIWVFFYCRKFFSLILKMVFSRFLKVGSSSFCCRDVLELYISVWRWLILIWYPWFYCECQWMLSLPYYGLFKVISFPFNLQGFRCYFICYASQVKYSCSSRFGKLYF